MKQKVVRLKKGRSVPLKEGQKVILKNGDRCVIEKGDAVTIHESYNGFPNYESSLIYAWLMNNGWGFDFFAGDVSDEREMMYWRNPKNLANAIQIFTQDALKDKAIFGPRSPEFVIGMVKSGIKNVSWFNIARRIVAES